MSYKWIPPESFEGVFNEKTDVWAFAVTVWEILTYGMEPYKGQTGASLKTYLENGHRLEIPHDCPKDLYDKVMLKCWSDSPEDRPQFAKIVKDLKNIIHEFYQIDIESELHSANRNIYKID